MRYFYLLAYFFTKLANPALAGDAAPTPIDTGLDRTRDTAGLPKGEISDILGGVLGAVLGFLGTLFLILIVVGGIMWMTSAGNEDQVRKAKSLIVAAFIGVLIIFLSYAFSLLIGRIIGGI